MKILLTSDLHVGVRKKNGILFINFAINYLNYIQNYCKKNNIDNIFFLGDILEKSSSVRHEYFTPLFRKLHEIRDNKINIIYLLGNHDIYTKENDSLVETFPGKIIKHQELVTINGIVFNFLSFTDGKIGDLTGDYLMTHLPIEGFRMNQDYIPDREFYPKNLFKNFKKVFSGHYHYFQVENDIIYLGSPFQLNFSETLQKKGFVVLDTDKDDWAFVEYRNGPKFKVIDDLNKKTSVKNSFVKIKIQRDDEDFHAIKLNLFAKGALSVEPDFIPEESKRVEQENNIKLDHTLYQIVKKFLKDYKHEGINNNKLIEIFEIAHKELEE